MNNFFRQCLTFDDMLTPKIIKVLYWVLSVIAIIAGLIAMFTNGFYGFITGLIGLILGLIGIRVYCELIILFFNIYHYVRRISSQLDEKNNTASASTSQDS